MTSRQTPWMTVNTNTDKGKFTLAQLTSSRPLRHSNTEKQLGNGEEKSKVTKWICKRFNHMPR